MSTNLEMEKGKGREKEKVGNRPAKINEKKQRWRASKREKKQGRHFLLKERENFVACGEKMGNASGQRGEMSGSEKKSEQEFVRHFLHKPFTRKFLEVSRCSRAKQRQKQLCCTCRVDLLLSRPTVVCSPFSLPSPLSLLFCLNNL